MIHFHQSIEAYLYTFPLSSRSFGSSLKKKMHIKVSVDDNDDDLGLRAPQLLRLYGAHKSGLQNVLFSFTLYLPFTYIIIIFIESVTFILTRTLLRGC